MVKILVHTPFHHVVILTENVSICQSTLFYRNILICAYILSIYYISDYTTLAYILSIYYISDYTTLTLCCTMTDILSIFQTALPFHNFFMSRNIINIFQTMLPCHDVVKIADILSICLRLHHHSTML
jgi:hypothetical protein